MKTPRKVALLIETGFKSRSAGATSNSYARELLHFVDEESVVRLLLRHVAHAPEARMRGQFAELRRDVRRAEIDPADDAFEVRRAGGERKKPAGFLERLPRLHRDAAVEPGRGE